jgi:hypothetical protein
MKPRKVALYGRNMVLSTIGACLQKNQAFQVEQIEVDLSEIFDKAPLPDVVLFDIETAQSHFVLSLIHDYPAIIFIGVDLRRNQMLVLSGESSRLLTIEDLVTVIEKRPFQKDLQMMNNL